MTRKQYLRLRKLMEAAERDLAETVEYAASLDQRPKSDDYLWQKLDEVLDSLLDIKHNLITDMEEGHD